MARIESMAMNKHELHSSRNQELHKGDQISIQLNTFSIASPISYRVGSLGIIEIICCSKVLQSVISIEEDFWTESLIFSITNSSSLSGMQCCNYSEMSVHSQMFIPGDINGKLTETFNIQQVTNFSMFCLSCTTQCYPWDALTWKLDVIWFMNSMQ